MPGHDSSRPDNLPIGVTILTCVRRTTPPPNERSHMHGDHPPKSLQSGKWQMAGQQMTNDMFFASGCDKAGKGGLGSNLGFEKMKHTALSLSLPVPISVGNFWKFSHTSAGRSRTHLMSIELACTEIGWHSKPKLDKKNLNMSRAKFSSLFSGPEEEI